MKAGLLRPIGGPTTLATQVVQQSTSPNLQRTKVNKVTKEHVRNMINGMFGMINHIKQLHFDLYIMIRCLFELAIHDMIPTLPEKKMCKVVRF